VHPTLIVNVVVVEKEVLVEVDTEVEVAIQ
jgi:hypothetical protein